MNNYNKEKRIVESYEDFIQNRNESLNEGVLDWGRDIKDKVVAWLNGIYKQTKQLPLHNEPYIMSIANRIVSGGRVSEEEYTLFLEETGLMDRPDTTKPKTLSDRYFDYDGMLELVLDNMSGWGMTSGLHTLEQDVHLDFQIRWEDGDYTRVYSERVPQPTFSKYPTKKIKLKVGANEKNIYMLDESSPKNIFEYYSYGLDTETLRSFCKDISEQAPEKRFNIRVPAK